MTSSPISLSTQLSDVLLGQANAYAATHSIQIQTKSQDDQISSITAPISLLPNAFPRSNFEQAQSLAPSFNNMMDQMSRDSEFLTSVLEDVGKADLFTGKLLEMYQKLYGDEDSIEGQFARTADRLGILRSDYMLDSKSTNDGEDGKYRLLQVELNTIASSFAGLATNVAAMHRYLTTRFGSENHGELNSFIDANVDAILPSSAKGGSEEENGVPHNPALENLPKAMQLAHESYISHFLSSNNSNDDASPPPIIAFIVQPGETNTIDQRLLEFKLWNQYETKVVRLSLQDIPNLTEFDSKTGALSLTTTGEEISLVYFRAGYAPTDYPTEDCWEGRMKLEQSRATKCPNLGYHLCGTKKMQQHLSRAGVVEKFVPSESDAEKIRGAFAGLFSLSSIDMEDNDYDAVKRILKEHEEESYVLKPQREGGGYNYYGENLAKKLAENVNTVNEGNDMVVKEVGKELAEFILMERIFPPHQNAILLRSGLIEGSGPSISELGCFGCILSDSEGAVLHNEYAGFLLRTKFVGVNEGGVASGFATLSSPYLC